MLPKFISTAVLGLLCLVAKHSYGVTYTCDGGEIKIGDSKFEVSSRCGEPTHTDFTKISRLSETSDTIEQTFVDVEDWLYNFGPFKFVTVFTFENGKLIGIRAFGYGRSDGEDPDFNKKVKLGAPTVRILFLYGAPSYKEERTETTYVSHKDGPTVPKTRHIEEWTYNLGPNRFMRIYHFVNGRLVRIEQGDKGF